MMKNATTKATTTNSTFTKITTNQSATIKRVIQVSIGFIGSFAIVASLQASPTPVDYISPSLERKLVKICEAIQSNNRFKLKLALKKTHIKIRDVKKGLVCNGMSALDFALSENAFVVAKHLSPSLSEEYLAKLMDNQSDTRK
ncbi:DUF3718 domain-containing protein [Glaciecola sp. MH2013]|uniref:DUF3718 domain-containing protein n=1 Tax=Glaciecola sp. MH2013 TaxID=2785524 RepID=UPI0018A00674|nr:DUF3718 domain-containing protein [Glaciecola sp. MH2013]MBF7074669.1 DUF3718 domain-containing protein [Glaciecola sp. MH2013]